MTHRSDESGRVSLAGCSPAEPASVSSTHSGYQSFYVRSVSDPPAGPRVFRGCARGLRLPIDFTVCFEAGRFTLTQSSWTASARRCSRKWMSGHAGKALVLISDRGQPKAKTFCSSGNLLRRVNGNLRFLLTITYHGCPRNLGGGNLPISRFSCTKSFGPESLLCGNVRIARDTPLMCLAGTDATGRK